jgi:hypothetical protein
MREVHEMGQQLMTNGVRGTIGVWTMEDCLRENERADMVDGRQVAVVDGVGRAHLPK